MSNGKGVHPEHLQTAEGTCVALLPSKISSSKDPSPPKADVFLPGGDQEENFTRISSLFAVWDSPIITHFLMTAHSPVS